MYLSDDFFAQWDHIISSVDEKTNVPIECLNRMIIRLINKRQKTINITKLRQQGLEAEEIETVLSRNLLDLEDQIRDVEFVLDVAAVAHCGICRHGYHRCAGTHCVLRPCLKSGQPTQHRNIRATH
jgi:hypothetical protein